MICYTLLAADPASNVDFFFTDNLSGCSVLSYDRPVGVDALRSGTHQPVQPGTAELLDVQQFL